MRAVLIDQRLLDDILDRNQDFLDSAEAPLRKSGQLRSKTIEEEALQHSIRLESDLDPGVAKETQIYKECLKELRAAYKWARHSRDSVGVVDLVKGVNGHIQNFGTPSDFREITQGVSIKGASVRPPYPEKMREEIKLFESDVRDMFEAYNSGSLSVMEIAIYCHFQTARIHPFVDGNGRTARMVQNVLLEKDQLPPGVVFRGERETYHQLLDDAVVGHKEREGRKTPIMESEISEGEKKLYNYLATKVNIALDLVTEGTLPYNHQ
jgi:Fic family protein